MQNYKKLLMAAAATLVFSANALAVDKYKVGIEGAYPPFNNKNASGEVVGFDPDIAMALCAWRLWCGPETTDRILALDTLYMNGVALVVLLGLRWNTALLFEAALLVAMLGFVGTVGLARYLTRGDVVEK